MKVFLSAIALTLAVPAAAQTTPADPHAGHARHQQKGSGHEGHGMNHAQHAEHMACCKEGKKDCCDKAKQAATSAADCCKEAEVAAKAVQQPQPHGEHAH